MSVIYLTWIGVEAGIEEATVIALHQSLMPAHSKAILLFPSMHEEGGWQREWQDEARQRYHQWKMESKLRRSNAQLDSLSLLQRSDLWVEYHEM